MPSAGEDGASDFRHEFALTKVDSEGNVLLSTDINALFEGKDGFSLRKQLLCDNEGNVYLLLAEGRYGSLQVYDGDGQPLYAPAEKISTVAVTENGTVMAAVQNEPSNGSVSLRAVEAGAGRLGEKRDPEVGCSYLYGGPGDALLINDSQKLYSYDTETGEYSVVFDWFDIDIVNSNTKYFGALPDGRYVLLGSGIYSDAPDIIMLEAVPASSLREKTVLTLATGYATPAQKAAAVQFGRANPDYKIKIVEYCDVNVADTTSPDRFYVDINAGNVPDMIDFDYFDARRLIRAGVMEDLYPYLDSDPELRRSDLLPNLIEAIETGGCLYYLPHSFYLRVIAGDAGVVGDGTVWNMQKLYEVAENHKEFEYIMGSLCGLPEFMKLTMEFNMNTFVDFENQSCNFDKSEFYELLNFAKTYFPADGDASVFHLAYKQFAPIMEGEQMLYCGNVFMPGDIMLVDELFAGNASFVGFPSEDGKGNVFVPESSMGITKASKHKEIAWEFLRGFYTEESYNISADSVFPSNINALRSVLGESEIKVFSTNDAGEQTETAKFSYSFSDRDGQQIKIGIKALTPEDMDRVWNIITGIKKISAGEKTIETIVAEEAGAYALGSQTAEETAAMINSRVRLLLGERT